MTLSKEEQGLFGFVESYKPPYPVTDLVLVSTAQREMAAQQASEAREIAINEAVNQSNERAAEVQFDRDTTLGAVVKPKTNTLRGYKWMLRQNDGVRNVEFSQHDYKAFDGRVVEMLGVDESGRSNAAAFNSAHPHYQDFAPLRRNIALLRNYLLSDVLFKDGEYIPDAKTEAGKEDLAHYRMLNEMADHLGQALASNIGGEPSFLRRWARSVGQLATGQDLSMPYSNAFMEAANVPDQGVLAMYSYLKGLQKEHKFSHWPLPDRKDTPFSDENIRKYSRSSMMMGVSDAYESDMSALRAPENLKDEDQVISVKLAREILERLKNLMANPETQERLSQFTDEDHEKSRKLLQVAMGFKDALAEIKASEDELNDGQPSSIARARNTILDQSIDAFEKLGYRMKVETHKMLVEEYQPTAARKLRQEMEDTPASYKTSESTESLLDQVNSGLKEVARIQAQARIAQKMAERAARKAMQQNLVRIQNNARQNVKLGKDVMQKMRTGDIYSSATIRGTSNSTVSKNAQDAQDKAHADALREREAALDTHRGR